jgi:long-chain acyl-CoA synthetase
MVSGSAPLSENVMMFFRCMLGIGVVEGYGQTEGCAGATISHPDDIATVGHVGGPIGTCEICLFDVPDMGYYKTDKAHGRVPCEGRGEICIRGPNVFMGYYKDEAKTKEIVDEEGWLHSGDIGMWSLEGNLHIIDRKKNIFKLAQGEYVAPEKIENILTRSTLISQCFVYGDSKESSLVAIIVPDEDPLRQWAVSSDNCGLSFEELCKSNALKDAIMEDVRRLGRESGLQGFEMVKAIFIEAEPFSVEKDLLTPTFKLKRNKVRDAYETVIKDLYAGLHELRSKL